jgi:hypothetical protein
MAKMVTTKLKNLRRVLRAWQGQLSNLNITINNNKVMLSFLDMIEESRDMTLKEWNFRKIIRDHLGSLLEHQRIYWKQRGKIKWATLGAKNTKKNHSTATIRKNKNGIRSLLNDQGIETFDHETKASILWESFKDRLGVSEFTHMYFDLSILLHRTIDLDVLEGPFTHEEINGIIKELSSEKSPGPDGFNSDFMKRCWQSQGTFMTSTWHFIIAISTPKASMVPMSLWFQKTTIQLESMITSPYPFSIV